VDNEVQIRDDKLRIQQDQIAKMVGDDLPNGARLLALRWTEVEENVMGGVVLAVRSGHSPFVTWRRTVEVSLSATGHPFQTDSCFWGHYFNHLQDALNDFEERVEAITHEKAHHEALKNRGIEDGTHAASWLVDGNTPEPVRKLRWILQGMEDGDPEILDQLPHPSFCGEWAGEGFNEWARILLDEEVIEDIVEYDDDNDREWLASYEEGWDEGLYKELRRMYESYADKQFVPAD
jgi:hypothetical protein